MCDTIQGPFICGSDAIDVNVSFVYLIIIFLLGQIFIIKSYIYYSYKQDNLLLTASWIRENSLNLWDIRKCHKVLLNLPIVTQETKKSLSPSNASGKEDDTRKLSNGEYLYACKFFSSSNHHTNFEQYEPYSENYNNTSPNKSPKTKLKLIPEAANYSTVLACGSGTQSLHLIDYEKPSKHQHLASFNCKSPLYCLDAIYSCSMIACGGMRKFFTLMSTSANERA